jgi:excisionase family DNA binding protein
MDGTLQDRPSNVLEPRTYTVEEIATILGIGRTSAYRIVKEGHFKIVRVGSSIRVSRKSFDEWLDTNMTI